MKVVSLIFVISTLSYIACGDFTTKVTKRNIVRKKRYLMFLTGSNLVITLSAVKALLRIQPTGWNFLEEMDFPFSLPTDNKWIYRLKGHKKHKREVYDTIKSRISQTGLNGTACVKRMMCDVKKYLPWKGKSLVKDILLALFSFDNTGLTHEETCNPDLFNDCTVSILDYLFLGKLERISPDV